MQKHETAGTVIDRKIDTCYVYRHDSVLIKVAGDTVQVEKYRYLYRDRMRVDTLVRTDTVRIETYQHNTEQTEKKQSALILIIPFLLLVAIITSSWMILKK